SLRGFFAFESLPLRRSPSSIMTSESCFFVVTSGGITLFGGTLAFCGNFAGFSCFRACSLGLFLLICTGRNNRTLLWIIATMYLFSRSLLMSQIGRASCRERV